MELMRLAEILIECIKRDYPGDIAIVHLHGSAFYKDVHPRSDLDLYFVPKTQRGYKLACSFIFDGIGTDLWGISWERLAHIASHEESIASIVTEGEILYYGDADDLARFEQLKQKALDTGDRDAWLARARKQLDKAYKNGFLAQHAKSLSQVRTHAIGLVYDLAFALSQLNQITIKRGRKNLKQEILAMPLVPENFAFLYDAIFLENDEKGIQDACMGLLTHTEKLLSDACLAAHPPKPFAEAFAGWYEEMIQSYHKIAHACETGDLYTPLFASVEFSHELGQMLSQVGLEAVLPDMVGAYDSENLAHIAAVARAHQKAFESLLNDQGVTPLRFSTFEEVETYLAGR